MRMLRVKRFKAEAGVSLPEVMVAAVILVGGTFGAIGAFASSKRTTVAAQRQALAGHVAKREIEKLRSVSYKSLKLTAVAPYVGDPAHIAFGTAFFWKPGAWECMVTGPGVSNVCQTDDGVAATVAPTETLTVSGEAVHVVRYISWRNESCPVVAQASPCDGTQNTKRITVAVYLDARAGSSAGPLNTSPVWESAIVSDRNAIGPSQVALPDAGSHTGPKNVYLYANQCGGGDNYSGPPPADVKTTHNTRSYGATSSFFGTLLDTALPSYCENNGAYADGIGDPSTMPERRRPDLMGATAPSGSAASPLRDYSADPGQARPAGSPTGGLRLRQISGATSCSKTPRYFTEDDQARTTATKPSRWNTHAWSTKPLPSEMHLRRTQRLSFYAAGLGGVSGQAKICATLIARSYNSASHLINDHVLADASMSGQNQSCTPTLPAAFDANTPLRCEFELDPSSSLRFLEPNGTEYWRVGDGMRLMLVLRVLDPPTSAGVALAFDHPSYPSFLQLMCDPSYCSL